MISFLRGLVAEKTDKGIVLDVSGVGYGLMVTHECFGSLSVGTEAHLVVFEHIKEDSHDLYGFLDQPSKAAFELLLGVNGVGPKMALNILNIGNSNDLRAALASGDVTYISSASGVGKKLAERLIVDLKDKVGLSASDDATAFINSPSVNTDEAMQALVALGFSAQEANSALSQVDTSLDTEERIRMALKAKRS